MSHPPDPPRPDGPWTATRPKPTVAPDPGGFRLFGWTIRPTFLSVATALCTLYAGYVILMKALPMPPDSHDPNLVWYAPLSALMDEPRDVPGVSYDTTTMVVSIHARDSAEAIKKAKAFFRQPVKEVADMEAALESFDLMEEELPVFRDPNAAATWLSTGF